MAKNYLKALAKTLSTVAGPFGAPCEFLLSIYEDEQTQKREAQIYSMLLEGQNLTRETLEEIFQTRGEIKELRKQFIIGMQGCLCILAQNRELLSSPEKIEQKLPFLIDKEQLEKSGFITKGVLTKELSQLYANSPNLFLTTIGMAGFPNELIPQGDEPKVIIFKFVNRCVNLAINQQINIFNALSEENPNSDILGVQVKILQEKALNDLGG